jgi:sugar phosphate isomerase/epimerase
MKIGIATTVLREHSVTYALDQIARAGYHSAEVWLWHLERTGEDPRVLARQAKSLGLALTLHAPSADLNPTSTNLPIARESRRQIAASLEVAAQLQARAVAVHPGRKTVSRSDPELVWGQLMDWLGNLDDQAARLGLRIGLELMEKLPLEVFMLPEDAARLMSASWRSLGLTVDLAHLNTHGDPPRLLADLAPPWITHVHLSDNAPTRVHLPLGAGTMDLGAALAAIARVYDGIVSIEGSTPGQGVSLLAENMACLRQLGYA